MQSVETIAGSAISPAPLMMPSSVRPRAQVAFDVLDRHGGVIHENADRERETAERQEIDRLAERAEHGDGRQHGERDGNGDDDRAPPRPEEEQDHQRSQRGGDHALVHHGGDRRADEERLIDELAHRHIRGKQR